MDEVAEVLETREDTAPEDMLGGRTGEKGRLEEGDALFSSVEILSVLEYEVVPSSIKAST